MNTEDYSQFFDWPLYGSMVRRLRNNLGYTQGTEFADTIWRRTRVRFGRDSLAQIEQGKRVPNATQFMALNLTLWGSPFPQAVFDMCACDEWDAISRNYGSWAEDQDRFPPRYHSDDEALMNDGFDVTRNSPLQNPYVPHAWKQGNTDAEAEKVIDEKGIGCLVDQDAGCLFSECTSASTWQGLAQETSDALFAPEPSKEALAHEQSDLPF